MSPKVSQKYLEAKRREIIAAAVKCYVEKGFHKVTMQDIYSETKLSPGAVYNYFGSKDEILAEAAKTSRSRNEQGFAKAAKKNPGNPLSAFGEIYAETLGKVNLAKVTAFNLSLYAESVDNPVIAEPLKESHNEIIKSFTDFAIKQQEKGNFNKELKPQAIAQVMTSILTSAGIQYIFNPDFDMEAYFEVYKAIAEGTICPGSKEKII